LICKTNLKGAGISSAAGILTFCGIKDSNTYLDGHQVMNIRPEEAIKIF
jgi:hypothetical protein